VLLIGVLELVLEHEGDAAGGGWHVIDSTHLTGEETVDEVMDLLA